MTTAQPAHFTVAHALKRRVRIHTPVIRKDPERAYVLEILLRKNPQVKRVRAVPDIGSVVIHFDPHGLPRPRLMAQLDAILGNLGNKKKAAKAARKVDVEGPLKEVSVAVEGMTCASCSLLVELMLNRDPRVAQASVNYASETACVVGDIDRDDVYELVSRLGYEARPMDTLSQRRLVIEREKERLEEARKRMIVAGALTLPVMVIGMAMPHAWWLKAVEFALTTPVVFWAGKPFFTKAAKLAKQRTSNMDTLIAMGAGAAYGYSLPAFIANRHHLYFEAAAGIVSFVLLGRYLEERAKGKAGDAIRKLIDLQPQTATVIRNGVEEVLPVDDVEVGDMVVVRPGERVPVDGEVVSGVTTVDESMLTGESLPVIKEAGHKMTAGCVNGNGTVRFRATAVGMDTVLAGIVHMVDEAQASKLPVQKMADKISSVFVPSVMGGAALTLVGWLVAGAGWGKALANAISVLLIACPCSLGLATPTAIMAGTGQGAKRGVFIRNGESLETASRLTTLVFDKTGTITEGRPVVATFSNTGPFDDKELLDLAATAEHGSEHYLGKAVLDFARSRGVEPGEAEDFHSETGRGVRASVQGRRVVVGNRALLDEEGAVIDGLEAEAQAQAAEGRTPVFVAVDGKASALFAIADEPRETAKAAIARLHDMGIKTLMVTGDVEAAARNVAGRVGIDSVVAGASPRRKLEIIEELRELGDKVGMIGDGINDAPALAAADVGFAVGTGTDVAIEASHITLVSGDIAKVADAIDLSRRTMRIIKQNLFWAMGYNTVSIPVAAAGRLTPMVASLAMALSSVSVVTNSLRLQKGGEGES